MTQHYGALDVLIEISNIFSEGVVIFDNESRKIVHINSAAQQITSLSTNSSIADLERFVARLSIEDRKRVQVQLSQLIQRTRCNEVEFRLSTSNIITNICVSAYLLMNNFVTLVILRDITKSKVHENYLIEYGTKKNTTLDGVVHFVSGALSLMHNLSEEANKSMHSGNGSAGVYLGLIDKNISHCLEVVKGLLIEEHDKSPNIFVKKSTVNVAEKISYIIDNLRSSYPNRTFRFRHPTHEILADIDEIKVLQIINNLVFNAIKFSSPELPITVGIVDDNHSISIYVADSGIGIPSELQPYVFVRNGVAGRQGLAGEQSFGKGLSICKKLANLMKGDISFESSEGSGSTFYLTIPSNLAIDRIITP